MAVAGIRVGRSADKPDPASGENIQNASADAAPALKEKKAKGNRNKAAGKQKKKTDDNEGTAGREEDAKKQDGSEKVSAQLELPLPTGQDSRGVVIPITDDVTGKKSMSFDIGVARRLDENHVKMTNLVIETFADGSDEKEMTIELPDSMLDMKTGVITGKESVTIKRSDFKLTGKTMEFNTNTRKGKVQGDVKMIIYDLNLETSPSSPDAEKTGG